jgi:hypothetical protein
MVSRVLTIVINKLKTMKKYFCVETDEQIVFGDVIHLTMSKDMEDGKIIVEKEVEFSEDTMDWLVDLGFVEERDEEETPDDELLDFDDEKPCEILEDLIEDFETLEERVDKIETITTDVLKELTKVVKVLIEERKEKETPASPKKKNE